MVYQYGLRLAERSKSGGPSLGRSPGAHKQRRPAKPRSNPTLRGNRVDTIFRAGLRALLFFLEAALPQTELLPHRIWRPSVLCDVCFQDARWRARNALRMAPTRLRE